MYTAEKAQYWAFIAEQNPGERNFRKKTFLRTSATPGSFAWTILWFANPFPTEGANVGKAELVLHARPNNNGGRHEIRVQRANKWDCQFWDLSWQHRPPAVGPHAVWSKTGKVRDGENIRIDVTQVLQEVASGAPFYGLILWGGTPGEAMAFDGTDKHPPRLEVTWWTNPYAPTDLAPATNTVVATPTPVLRWTFFDKAGRTDIAQMQVQTADSQNSFTVPLYDSGQIPTILCEFNPAEHDGWPQISTGKSLWWRVRIADGDGRWSPWSQPARYMYHTKPTLEMLAPQEGTIGDSTPPVVWKATPGTGGPVKAWRVMIVDDQQRVHDDSGIHHSGDTSWTPSKPVPKGVHHWAWMYVWDEYPGRVTTPGDPPYRSARRGFTYDPVHATDTYVSGAKAVQRPGTPIVDITWDATGFPDGFFASAGGKRWTFDGKQRHFTVTVPLPKGHRQILVGHLSNGHEFVEQTLDVDVDFRGTWIIDESEDSLKYVAVVDDLDHDMTQPETSSKLEPLGARHAIVVVSAQHGYEGKLEGKLVDMGDTSDLRASSFADLLMDWKPQVGKRFSMIIENLSFQVMLSDIQMSGVNREAGRMWRASCDFRQVDNWLFKGGVL